MTDVNRHGLSRSIPSDIKRQVRQRCGFGCIKCASAVYEYEHLDPSFQDATVHDPNGIVLLCGTCHSLKTKGVLSQDTLKEWAASPACRAKGFSFGEFDITGKGWPELIIGSFRATAVAVFIQVMGEDVFSLRPPVEVGQPFRVSALFRDARGIKTLEIVDNEWRSGAENWDVEFVGSRLTIRSALYKVTLAIRAEPPQRLIVERLDMEVNGAHLVCRDGSLLEVRTPHGLTMQFENCEVSNCDYGIVVDAESAQIGVMIKPPSPFHQFAHLLRRNSSLTPPLGFPVQRRA